MSTSTKSVGVDPSMMLSYADNEANKTAAIAAGKAEIANSVMKSPQLSAMMRSLGASLPSTGDAGIAGLRTMKQLANSLVGMGGMADGGDKPAGFSPLAMFMGIPPGTPAATSGTSGMGTPNPGMEKLQLMRTINQTMGSSANGSGGGGDDGEA